MHIEFLGEYLSDRRLSCARWADEGDTDFSHRKLHMMRIKVI